MYQYSAKVVHVVDGDTVDLDVDLGFNVCVKVRFRLDGINSPEKKTPTLNEGKASQAHLEQILNDPANSNLMVHSTGKDKYGRWVAKLMCVNSNTGAVVDINQKMIDDGFAVPYVP